MHAPTTLLALLLLTPACALPTLEVQPRYASLALEGQAGMSPGGLGGSADLEQAGLDERDTGVAGRVDFRFGSPHLVLLAGAPRFEGQGTLDVTIDDGTNTITAGATVDSTLDLEHYDAALLFDLVPGDTVEVALGVGAAYLDLALRFDEVGTGTTIESSEALPVPLLCAAGSVWLGPLQASVFAGAVQYELDGDHIDYLDLDAFLRWRCFGGSSRLRGSLVGGYRRTEFDLEYDDGSSSIDADFTLAGPFFGLELAL